MFISAVFILLVFVIGLWAADLSLLIDKSVRVVILLEASRVGDFR